MENLSNYTQEKLTIHVGWANVFSLILIIPLALIYGIPYYLLWSEQISKSGIKAHIDNSSMGGSLSSVGYFLLFFLAGIVIHELIHGAAWAAFASKGIKSIRFGVIWKMLTPYCHCKEPLKIKHYIIGAGLPGFVLGFIPAVFAIVMGQPALLFIGLVFTLAAAGDILIINLLRRENWNNYVQDHPSEVGCYVYRKD